MIFGRPEPIDLLKNFLEREDWKYNVSRILTETETWFILGRKPKAGSATR